MKKILFILILMIASFGYSQNDESFVNSIVAQKFAELEMQGTPAYFYKKDFCEGNTQIFSLPDGKICSASPTYYEVYVFWKESDEVLRIQKFDNCGVYRPFSIAIQKSLGKLLDNLKAIKTETVQPYEGEKVDNNAFGNMAVKDCNKEYKFVLGKDTFEKSFKEFDLTNDSKYKNIHAESNNSLKLVELDKELSETIKTLDESGKFFREN